VGQHPVREVPDRVVLGDPGSGIGELAVQVVVGEQPLDLLGQVARVPGPEPQAANFVVGLDGGSDAAVVGDDRGCAVGHGLDGDHAERLPVDRRVDDAATVGKER